MNPSSHAIRAAFIIRHGEPSPARGLDDEGTHIAAQIQSAIDSAIAELFATMPLPPDDMDSPDGVAAFADAVLLWRHQASNEDPMTAKRAALAEALTADLTSALGWDENRLVMVLDDLVHDAQIANASEVNNEGAEAQIAALLKAGIVPETIRSFVLGD